jgi:SAM-dependent methyltransferase
MMNGEDQTMPTNTTDCGPELWDAIADDWDERIGVDGNDFHRELIRPATMRFLDPQPGERILDIACGNGIFACYLAERGIDVVGFDYSPAMIAHAEKRCAPFAERITLKVADATDHDEIIALGGGRSFDKAVANMAIMGIPDIAPLFKAVYDLLPHGGVFVFSATHPCFQTPGRELTPDGAGLITTEYIRTQRYSYQILADNPKSAYHWHRPLQDLLKPCFDSGFVLDGLKEPVFASGRGGSPVWENLPLPIVLRVRKV